MKAVLVMSLAVATVIGCGRRLNRIGSDGAEPSNSMGDPLYIVRPLQSRSISFENPSGAAGAGGRAAGKLGVGRKGAPLKRIEAGATQTLCDIAGAGTIHHIWMTGTFNGNRRQLRAIVVRAYWDDQKDPSIVAPLGDFFGLAHGQVTAYQSAVHSVGSNTALNIWLPMPFCKRARITFTNESDQPVTLYYQIDYTIGDEHPRDGGRLHALFRRENPTTLTRDFELLPKRIGKGRFIGCVIGVRSLQPAWWGEGEIKFYLDGDKEFPTICGTGSEDYVCQSYGMQVNPFWYHGTPLKQGEYVSMYRWHVADPIYWHKEIRVTIQQIGYARTGGLFERADDWSCCTFWYEPVPSARLPEMPGLAERLADLPASATTRSATTPARP